MLRNLCIVGISERRREETEEREERRGWMDGWMEEKFQGGGKAEGVAQRGAGMEEERRDDGT